MEGRLVWPTFLLNPLKPLYANRLCYLRSSGGGGGGGSGGPGQGSLAAFAATRPGHAYSDATFTPNLNKHSLALAAARSSQEPNVPREVLLMAYKSEVEARVVLRREAVEAERFAECSFHPSTSRAHLPARGNYVPGYVTKLEVRGESPALASLQASLLAGDRGDDEGGDAAAPLGGSRHVWLHKLAAFKQAAQRQDKAALDAAREASEASACTFRPKLTRAGAGARSAVGVPPPRREMTLSGQLEAAAKASPAFGEAVAAQEAAGLPGSSKPKGSNVRGHLERMSRVAVKRSEDKLLADALASGLLHRVNKATLTGGNLDTAAAAVASAMAGTARRAETLQRPAPPSSSREDLSTSMEEPWVEPPLLYVDVNISPTQQDRIALWLDTDCAVAAEAFAARHRLNPKLALRLTSLLESQRAAVLRGAASPAV